MLTASADCTRNFALPGRKVRAVPGRGWKILKKRVDTLILPAALTFSPFIDTAGLCGLSGTAHGLMDIIRPA